MPITCGVSGPASGVAGGRGTIWGGAANEVERREAATVRPSSGRSFSRNEKEVRTAIPGHGKGRPGECGGMPSNVASDCGSRHRSRIPSGEALKKPAGCGSIDAVSGLVYRVHISVDLPVGTTTPCFGRHNHAPEEFVTRDKCSPSSLTSCSSCVST